MVTIPNKQGGLGVPSTYTDTLTGPYGGFFLGSTPLPVITDLIVAASQDIPAGTPVGYDANGRIVEAVYDVDQEDNIQPIGITVTDVVTSSSTSYKGAPIAVQGALDFDMLNWPATFNTDAIKWAAFNGAPSPTAIVLKRRMLGLL